MALTKFGFLVSGAGTDPSGVRMEMNAGAFQMIAIGIPKAEHGVPAAKHLAAEGVQLLELCGGFGPVWTGKIIEAIGPSIPVGSVGYGPESIDTMYALFKD